MNYLFAAFLESIHETHLIVCPHKNKRSTSSSKFYQSKDGVEVVPSTDGGAVHML
jgi:hypothetical protein